MTKLLKLLNRLLRFLSYRKDSPTDIKLLYATALISFSILVFFFNIYLFLYRLPIVPALNIAATLINLLVLYLLKQRNHRAAKILLFSMIISYLFVFTFILFPNQTHVSYYYLGIPPVGYIIFDRRNRLERVLSHINSVVSLTIIITSRFLPSMTLIEMTEDQIRFFSISSLSFISIAITVGFLIYDTEINCHQDRLNLMAMTDPLTKAVNRRSFYRSGKTLFDKAVVDNKPFSLIILDIDHFKKVNDSYGHPTGDRVLVRLTEILKHCVRQDDQVARYGGEEFAILLPDVQSEQLNRITDQILQSIKNCVVKIDGDIRLSITASIGAVVYSSGLESFEEMIRKADEAMYKSKENGRDCITIVDDPYKGF